MQFTLEQQAEHRKLLVAALRSSEYEQGQNCLRSQQGFCCLGVACDVYDKWNMKTNNAASIWKPVAFPATERSTSHTFDYESGFLTSEVRNFFGIHTNNGELKSSVDGLIWSLIGMNDSSNPRYTFNDIADQFERGNVRVVTEPT